MERQAGCARCSLEGNSEGKWMNCGRYAEEVQGNVVLKGKVHYHCPWLVVGGVT